MVVAGLVPATSIARHCPESSGSNAVGKSNSTTAATALTNSEFDQNVSAAKEAALHGPVFITDGDRPTHVLLTIGDYQRLTSQAMSLAEALAHPGSADFEFEPPRLDIHFKPPDLD
jgi:hypothetical protein